MDTEGRNKKRAAGAPFHSGDCYGNQYCDDNRPKRPLLTLINVYEVAPDKQAELAQLLADATEKVMRHQPGFVSVNIHRSVDGTRVVNYAQWASKEDFERMMKSPEAQGQIKQFAALAKHVSPAVYQVSSVHTS